MSRPKPAFTARTEPYWRSGRDGRLRLATCQACGWRTHPPQPVCPKCQSFDIQFQPVSGEGRIYAWTLNRYPWSPGLPPPYVVADVELVEQKGLMILANIVDCPVESLRSGLPVHVAFEQVDDTFVPVFRP